VFEGQCDDGSVDDLNLLNLLLESLAVVLVPLSDLDVEDVVVELFDDFEVFFEHLLQVKK
jgi:hypothetical protein